MSDSPDLIQQFKELQSKTNLEHLSTYDKKTPKFTLKNTCKICRIVDVYDGDTVEEYLKIMVNIINGLLECMDMTLPK